MKQARQSPCHEACLAGQRSFEGEGFLARDAVMTEFFRASMLGCGEPFRIACDRKVLVERDGARSERLRSWHASPGAKEC